MITQQDSLQIWINNGYMSFLWSDEHQGPAAAH